MRALSTGRASPASSYARPAALRHHAVQNRVSLTASSPRATFRKSHGSIGHHNGVYRQSRSLATSSDVARGDLWDADAGAPAVVIREAVTEDYWEIAEVHCQSFYPASEFPLAFFVRLDRVLALHLGRAIEKNRQEAGRAGQFSCLVAAKELPQEPPTISRMLEGVISNLSSFRNYTKPSPSNRISAAIVVDTFVQYVPKRYGS
mmetsp:Transcript_29003/g.81689  ORF Transcript_29003/g.81689 Transcript_29003/m.81689 type:complete len:204 (-) Transcript_29003:724-1335(-)